MPVSKNIVLSKELVDYTDLSPLYPFLSWNPPFLQYFKQSAGQEPYKLLGFISKQCNGVITDVGTEYGSSALALSLNHNVVVETYDTMRRVPNKNPSTQMLTIENIPNIKYRILSGQSVMSKIAQSTVVYLDINSKDALEEMKFIKSLEELNFKGILIIDDININDAMKGMWNNVPKNLKKIDATAYGHWSGTGIIVYDPQFLDVNVLLESS